MIETFVELPGLFWHFDDKIYIYNFLLTKIISYISFLNFYSGMKSSNYVSRQGAIYYIYLCTLN